MFGPLRVRSLRIGFELCRVISSVVHFSLSYNSGFVCLWIGLLRVFGSKLVHPISGVGSSIDPGHSVQGSGLGSVLSGLVVIPRTKPQAMMRQLREREGETGSLMF